MWWTVLAAAAATMAMAAPGASAAPSADALAGRQGAVTVESAAWTPVGPMLFPQGHHRAVTLRDGRVLVIGGTTPEGVPVARAQLFDPVTGRWSETAPMHVARARLVAVTLRDGRVLVAGGYADLSTGSLRSAELFDPATGRWSWTGSMTQARNEFAGIRLVDGRVLVAGGWPGVGTSPGPRRTAEVYDPATGTWARVQDMARTRAGNDVLALLPGGRVLLAGGGYTFPGFGYAGRQQCQVFHPRTGTWTSTAGLSYPRGAASDMVRLDDGRVLITGGSDGIADTVATAEVYDPVARTWTQVAAMHVARDDPAATLLPDGRVLVAGGGNSDTLATLRSTEVYDPVHDRWTFAPSLPRRARGGEFATLPDGRVLLAGGYVIGSPEGLRQAVAFSG